VDGTLEQARAEVEAVIEQARRRSLSKEVIWRNDTHAEKTTPFGREA